MFSSAVNTVNAVSATGKASISYSMNKAQVPWEAVNSREQYIPEGPGFNVAPGPVKVPTASSSKKTKFP
jgi:hypothetical protein